MIGLSERCQERVLKQGKTSSTRESYERTKPKIIQFCETNDIKQVDGVVTDRKYTVLPGPQTLTNAYLDWLFDEQGVSAGSMNIYFQAWKYFLEQPRGTVTNSVATALLQEGI